MSNKSTYHVSGGVNTHVNLALGSGAPLLRHSEGQRVARDFETSCCWLIFLPVQWKRWFIFCRNEALTDTDILTSLLGNTFHMLWF